MYTHYMHMLQEFVILHQKNNFEMSSFTFRKMVTSPFHRDVRTYWIKICKTDGLEEVQLDIHLAHQI